MIRPLRARHRWILSSLAVVVPALFGLGLAARQPIPTMGELPADLIAAPDEGLVVMSRHDDAWPGLALRTTWLARGGPSTHPAASAHAVELEALEGAQPPDVLVYFARPTSDAPWTRGDIPSQLPSTAVLLGRLAGRAPAICVLPPEAAEGPGAILLYSLAHHAVVGATPIPPVDVPRGETP